MRDLWVIGACVVGFFVMLAFLARGTGETTAAVNDKVQIGQLQAEAAGARAEAETLRADLEKSRAELKQARETAEGLQKKLADLEMRAGKAR
jgi:hypothetical protein